MHRNEKHWLTDEEVETGTFGQSLELSVVEIRNMLPLLEEAFSGVEYMAGAIRSKELGFERGRIFWPVTVPNMECFGMAWTDDEELVAGIEPPPDLEEGWKLDPSRIRGGLVNSFVHCENRLLQVEPSSRDSQIAPSWVDAYSRPEPNPSAEGGLGRCPTGCQLRP